MQSEKTFAVEDKARASCDFPAPLRVQNNERLPKADSRLRHPYEPFVDIQTSRQINARLHPAVLAGGQPSGFGVHPGDEVDGDDVTEGSPFTATLHLCSGARNFRCRFQLSENVLDRLKTNAQRAGRRNRLAKERPVRLPKRRTQNKGSQRGRWLSSIRHFRLKRRYPDAL